jgi:hypothetical protein
MDIDQHLHNLKISLNETIYSYTDGSNNTYYISKDQIEYDPISPMMSNTGVYSGGPPAKESINTEQSEQIKIAFEQAAADTGNHLENRPKGSGTIDIYSSGQTFVLRMGADSKYNLENLLKKLLKR